MGSVHECRRARTSISEGSNIKLVAVRTTKEEDSRVWPSNALAKIGKI